MIAPSMHALTRVSMRKGQAPSIEPTIRECVSLCLDVSQVDGPAFGHGKSAVRTHARATSQPSLLGNPGTKCIVRTRLGRGQRHMYQSFRRSIEQCRADGNDQLRGAVGSHVSGIHIAHEGAMLRSDGRDHWCHGTSMLRGSLCGSLE